MKSIKAAGFVLLLAGISAAPACNRANDPKVQVSEALKNANISDINVDYDKDAKVIHLKGAVDTPIERDRAEQVAEIAVGTSGKVLNEVTVKGVDDRSANDNDGRIKDQLKDMVDRNPELRSEDITFEVNNGAVEIKGSVATASARDIVSRMARGVPGVREVANALEVKPAGQSDRGPASARPVK
jgi:osmotically-inducible protein OsmY